MMYFSFKNALLSFLHVWMYVTCVDAHEGKRTLDPQEQGLQKVMSHPTWVLGSELESSGRAASSPSPPALALTLLHPLLWNARITGTNHNSWLKWFIPSPLIPELGGQGWSVCVRVHLKTEFQNSQGYTEKPWLKKTKQNKEISKFL